MTIKNIMNTVNADPEVVITVFKCGLSECLYIGLYEDTTEAIYNLEVEEFQVNTLKDKGYRVDISNITIFVR